MPFQTIVLSPLLRKNKKHAAGGLSAAHKIKQFRTAQLHIQRNNDDDPIRGAERTPDFSGKGMLCLLFGTNKALRRRVLASLTVEAALVLPLFAVSICFLMMPLVIMDAEAGVQLQMEQAAMLLSGAACLKQEFQKAGKNEDENSKAEQYLGSSPQLIATFAYIASEYPGDLLGTPVPTTWKMAVDEDPMITLRVTSKTQFPLAQFLGNDWGRIGLISSRRAWVGRAGGSGRNWLEENKETPEEEDRLVYVARNAASSKRYHVSADCHYISNKMTAVNAGDLSSMRAAGGKKYYACDRCKPGKNGTVYIFTTSNLYHAGPSCSAIQSYAVEMKQSEAEKKGYSPCSYCGKKH